MGLLAEFRTQTQQEPQRAGVNLLNLVLTREDAIRAIAPLGYGDLDRSFEDGFGSLAHSVPRPTDAEKSAALNFLGITEEEFVPTLKTLTAELGQPKQPLAESLQKPTIEVYQTLVTMALSLPDAVLRTNGGERRVGQLAHGIATITKGLRQSLNPMATRTR
jgi:hypothetical protein